MDWMLRRLADRMGVMPAGIGESFNVRIRAEQPLSQGLILLIMIPAIALIVWLYRREGSASLPYKMFLAALRITLLILALFMLTESVLSVDRTGLPYFVVMVDDSASQQVVDQYADARAKSTAQELAKIAGHPEPDRLSLAKGLLLKDDGAILRELQKKHRVRLYLVSNTARPLAEIDKPTDITPGLCVTIRPASGAEGGTVTADAVVVGASSGGQCQKTGGADNAGLPASPLGGFRGNVDSINEKTIVITTLGTDGSKTKTTVEFSDTTLFADRHKVTADAIAEGKCIIAGGTNDTGGILQALTINLPLVVDGKCPVPKGS